MQRVFGRTLYGPLKIDNLLNCLGNLWYGAQKPTEIACGPKTYEKLIAILPQHGSSTVRFKSTLSNREFIRAFDCEITPCSEVEEGTLEWLNNNNPLDPRTNGKYILSETRADWPLDNPEKEAIIPVKESMR